MNWLIKNWYQRPKLISYLLFPFSLVYQFIIYLRQLSYRLGLKKITKVSVPVIIVGNLTVGGTGKTPLVIWLANFLRQQHYRPGIISRGYGGKVNHFPQWVDADSDPKCVGEEAILIAQQTHCPVVVASKRVLAAQHLLAHTDCNLIIGDDGLQHTALARDIEIIVIDGERRFGNEFCLPAGPLREPLKRLDTVDFLVTNGTAKANEIAMQLTRGKIYNLLQPDFILPPETITQPIHAVAAIGNPARFFNALRKLGLNVIEHPFPDHYHFTKDDFLFPETAIIMMTEKDAVKCGEFIDARFWCLPVQATLNKIFETKLLEKLKTVLPK